MILGTPFVTPDHNGTYGIVIKPKPTAYTTVKPKFWLLRRLCSHEWEHLYKEGLYFFQEHVGDVQHYQCSKCGETKIEENEP